MHLKYLSDKDIDVRLSFFKILHLWLPLLLSIYGVFNIFSLRLPPSHINLFLNILSVYFTVCLGHCLGLHRMLIHESFKSPAFMKPIFLLLSSFSGIGGPKTWIRVHALRDHWQNQKKAPRALSYDNSLLHDFFINLHCKILPKDESYLKRLPKEILSDKWVSCFEVLWVPLNIFFFLILCVFFNLQTAIHLIAFRVTVSIIGHWLVGYIVHKWGYKSYDLEDASEEGRNSFILGWFTFGEAYHNNHHKFPESASMGLKKSELDVSYISLLILNKLGLAKDIKLSCEHHSKIKKTP